MDETSKQVQKSATSLTAKVVVPVAVLQVLMWLFTFTVLDGGFVPLWYEYLWMLLGYWGVVWLIGALQFTRGWSLNRVVAATGWLPPVGCVFWLLWLSGLFRG